MLRHTRRFATRVFGTCFADGVVFLEDFATLVLRRGPLPTLAAHIVVLAMRALRTVLAQNERGMCAGSFVKLAIRPRVIVTGSLHATVEMLALQAHLAHGNLRFGMCANVALRYADALITDALRVSRLMQREQFPAIFANVVFVQANVPATGALRISVLAQCRLQLGILAKFALLYADVLAADALRADIVAISAARRAVFRLSRLRHIIRFDVRLAEDR